MTSIGWIHRDLRRTNNAAIHAALGTGSVFPVFILDPVLAHSSPQRKNFRLSRKWRETPPDMAAVRFAKQIVPPASSATAGETILRSGPPCNVLEQLIVETGAQAVIVHGFLVGALIMTGVTVYVFVKIYNHPIVIQMRGDNPPPAWVAAGD